MPPWVQHCCRQSLATPVIQGRRDTHLDCAQERAQNRSKPGGTQRRIDQQRRSAIAKPVVEPRQSCLQGHIGSRPAFGIKRDCHHLIRRDGPELHHGGRGFPAKEDETAMWPGALQGPHGRCEQNQIAKPAARIERQVALEGQKRRGRHVDGAAVALRSHMVWCCLRSGCETIKCHRTAWNAST